MTQTRDRARDRARAGSRAAWERPFVERVHAGHAESGYDTTKTDGPYAKTS
ncbi:MAG: hypothetical protein V4537_07015 [Pseudomonadota bacterium]